MMIDIKRAVVMLMLLMVQLTSWSQEKQEQADSIKNKVYAQVDKMPEFKGGEKKMQKYIQKHLVYPPKAYLEGRGGVSYLSFTVERDGSLSNIRVIKGASGGSDLDDAAMNVIKNMPKWKPGKLQGKKVRVNYNMPIRFIGV